MGGVDLVPRATGVRSGAPHRELFWRPGHYQLALIDGWKLQVNEGGSSWPKSPKEQRPQPAESGLGGGESRWPDSPGSGRLKAALDYHLQVNS